MDVSAALKGTHNYIFICSLFCDFENKIKMEVFNDENENVMLSQIADAIENTFYEIKQFQDKHSILCVLVP